ncbi:MAG TPA: hypothetical protein VF624_01150 [Tepidisphaeraceae bacterium]
MNLLSPRSIPTPLRIVIGVSVVLACAAFSAQVALGMHVENYAGMGAAIGIVAGLYAIVAARSDFLRWCERRGVWLALLITYGLRVVLAVLALVSARTEVGKWATAPDLYIGMWSINLANSLVGGGRWAGSFTLFAITMVDAILQHIALAVVFTVVLAAVRPFCAEVPHEARGFAILRPDSL